MNDIKTHGMTGKRNAVKEKTASAQLQIRLRPDDKRTCAALADAAGLTLSAWVLKAMEEKAEKDE
ncbi:DUF1778 domain-containing protein [Erwinia amylovora]|uniref:DUF1778 domain-containing protein n=1 Tax=Erwinia amylovora TaxID=552 RepID=UPI00211DC3B6|nr:DUF1778 domain-containing protein [Erwinia amylovora]